MAKLPAGLKLTQNRVAAIQKAVALLPRREVLVGFPEETATRDFDPDEPGPVTNAVLGYVHDNGEPAHNIPARPFMIPGMNDVKDKVTDILTGVAQKVLTSRDPDFVEKGFTRVGLAVQASIRNKFSEGIPPPLAESTLKARARKGRKGAAHELAQRAMGAQPSVEFAKPLIDTGQLRRAVNFVIRAKRSRIG